MASSNPVAAETEIIGLDITACDLGLSWSGELPENLWAGCVSKPTPLSRREIIGSLAWLLPISMPPHDRLPVNLTAFDMRFDMASKSSERSPSTVDKRSACQLTRRPAICGGNWPRVSLTALFKSKSFL